MYSGRVKHSDGQGKKPGWVIAGSTALGVIVAVGIFALGLGIGNGTIPISLSMGGGQNASLPDRLDYGSVDQLYRAIKANYDGKLDESKLLDGLKTGLAEATGDPYTVYFNPKDAEDFNNKLQGTFSGVGAELGQNSSGALIIVSPIEGFPADKAGLRPQDIIMTIDGKSTEGLSVEGAVTKIRGEKGTKVTLGILRGGEELEFEITRDTIKIASVKWEILDGNVGYLDVNQFSDDTGALARKAALDFKEKGVKGVILDLRGNPGGLVDASTALASLWLPEGEVILQERRGSAAVATDKANGNDILAGMRTVVLIDAGSASASEIVAGALKDHKAATLIGEKSFGKGSVQKVVSLPGGAELKVTMARWYRPSGENIDKKGIAPDQEVKMTDEDYKQQRDPQRDAATEFIKK